jgi:hypothetical protein
MHWIMISQLQQTLTGNLPVKRAPYLAASRTPADPPCRRVERRCLLLKKSMALISPPVGVAKELAPIALFQQPTEAD